MGKVLFVFVLVVEGSNSYGLSSKRVCLFNGKTELRLIWFYFWEAFGVGESRILRFDFDGVFLAGLFAM